MNRAGPIARIDARDSVDIVDAGRETTRRTNTRLIAGDTMDAMVTIAISTSETEATTHNRTRRLRRGLSDCAANLSRTPIASRHPTFIFWGAERTALNLPGRSRNDWYSAAQRSHRLM